MGENSDEFVTIDGIVRTEIRVRSSRFIAEAAPAVDKETALNHLARLTQEFFDATHHCYAYRLGTGESSSGSSDDGEPSGSAGKPIAGSIRKAGMTDLIVVVTRYYGGTKLGTGPLARAYGAAVDRVLQAASRVTRYVRVEMHITFPHPLVSPVMHALERTETTIAETTYDDMIHMRLLVRSSCINDLRAELTNQTGGKLVISPPIVRPSSSPVR
jgi:uncharacterized YigZ family protein